MFKKKTDKEKYKEVSSKIKELEKEKSRLASILKQDVSNVTEVQRTSVNAKGLQRMYPDIYAKVVKTTTFLKLILQPWWCHA